MMPVGDDEGLLGHFLGHGFDEVLVRDSQQGVAVALFVLNVAYGMRDVRFRQQALNVQRGIGVKPEDRIEVHLGGSQQVQAVHLGTGERFFVGPDRAGVKIFQSNRRDKTRSHAFLPVDGIGLPAQVDRGLLVPDQNAVAQPLLPEPRRTGIAVLLLVIPGMLLPEINSDDVIGGLLVQHLPRLRGDYVVWGRHH